jgi:MOSC domain-containing protein
MADRPVSLTRDMRVAELWRYPIKSLRGEALEEAELTALGIAGDRLVHVRRPAGRIFTARTQPQMLGLEGSLADDGTPMVGGARWDSPEALAALRNATAPDAEAVFYDGDGPERFDVLPISVATDGGVAGGGV